MRGGRIALVCRYPVEQGVECVLEDGNPFSERSIAVRMHGDARNHARGYQNRVLNLAHPLDSPSLARRLQAARQNVSIVDKPFTDGLFFTAL
jgi:hypothetical protein